MYYMDRLLLNQLCSSLDKPRVVVTVAFLVLKSFPAILFRILLKIDWEVKLVCNFPSSYSSQVRGSSLSQLHKMIEKRPFHVVENAVHWRALTVRFLSPVICACVTGNEGVKVSVCTVTPNELFTELWLFTLQLYSAIVEFLTATREHFSWGGNCGFIA